MQMMTTKGLVAGLCLFVGLGVGLASRSEAGVPNTMEQRLAACSQCHGARGQGNAQALDVPHLAGKPAGYLYQQLQSFKSGRRTHAAMQYVVDPLSLDYLRAMANYYARQPLRYEPAPLPDVAPAVMQRGEQVVRQGDVIRSVPACASCHGARLTGVKPMIPGILGLSYPYLQKQLSAWQSNERSAANMHCMWVVANRMSKRDIKAVAAWLSSQSLPEDTSLITEDELPQPLPGWCGVDSSEVVP